MSNNEKPKIDQEKFQEKKDLIINQLEDQGFSNIANAIKTSTAKELADDNTIKAWKSAYPDIQNYLQAIQVKAKQFLQNDYYVATPEKYFERNSNGTNKFKPDKLAKELEEEYHFKYVEDTGQFYVFLDNYWQERAERIIKEECNKRLGKEYEPQYTRKTIDTINGRDFVSTTKKEFRPAKKKIPFQNCTYNLETNEKEEHSPQDNFTHKIPYELDRDAQCPEINQFLEDVLEKEKDKELILETVGYSMLSDMPFGHALLLHGEGKNGKSVLLNIWKKMLGEDNYKEEDLQQLENGRFATRWLYRKLSLFSDDMPSTKLETGNTLKSLTGGGDTRAEIKGGDHFEFKNFATPVFACNEIPASNDDSDGFYRRWEIINFPYKFVDNPVKENQKKQKPKNELINILTSNSEMKGFINEALTRLELIFEHGGFHHKTDAESTRKLWKSYSTPFEQFIENCLEQGLTPNDIDNLENEGSTDLNDYGYDFIVYDDLVWLIKKYCEHYGQRPPTKTKITQYLKNDSPYYVQVGRTRQIGNGNDRTKVYKFIRFSDDFLEFLDKDGEVSECPYFFQNLCAHVQKLKQNIEKTVDTVDTNYYSTTIAESIKEFITQKQQEMVDKQDLIESLEFEEEKIEEKISALEHDGEIYEPEPGKMKVI